MQLLVSRRSILLGGSAGALIGSISNPVSAAFLAPRLKLEPLVSNILFQGIFARIAVGVASGWLVEVMKNYGLVPGVSNGVNPAVSDAHWHERSAFEDSGYNVDDLYTGHYSAGDLAISGLSFGHDYIALGTSDHGTSTCCLVHYVPDICALQAVTTILSEEGFSAADIEAAAMPIHGDRCGEYTDFGHSTWRSAETPSGGNMMWQTHQDHGELQVDAKLRSTEVKANVSAIRESGRWKYAYDRV